LKALEKEGISKRKKVFLKIIEKKRDIKGCERKKMKGEKRSSLITIEDCKNL